MLEIEVCCEWCLNEFIVETHLPSVSQTVCPYCKKYTRTDVNDEETIEHNEL